jgi:4-amino-4-deoxy-L-arabinose transferase-like glycosyltransferase
MEKVKIKSSTVIARPNFLSAVAIFVNKNRLEVILISVIVLLSLFLRIYKIDQYLTFLGDEGRDVRIVRDLITKGNLVFIGPQTSVGNMYLGPLYYYLIAPSLALFGLSPIGPAVMNALIGSLVVFGVWFVGRQWFSSLAGLLGALLYALSPVAIIYSRSSWNPNPTPLFALICAYGMYLVWQNKEYKWLPWVGLSFAAALQMHYLALLLLPFLGIFWLLTLIREKKNQILKHKILIFTLFAFLIFCAMMFPLVLFDLKHQGMNFNAFKTFFTNRETTVNLNPARSDRFIPVMVTMVTDLITARQKFFPELIGLLVLALSFYYVKFSKAKIPLIYILTWILFSILGLAVYKQHVYIHYLGFMYPAMYLLLGFLISNLLLKNKFTKLIGAISLVFLLFVNVKYSPLKDTPNNQLKVTEHAVDLIIKESKGEPFNFALIAKQNYDESYRYFFENKKSLMYRGEDRITDQLFVICEDGDKCQPEGSPVYQIAKFGQGTTTDQWTLDRLRIYRLIHFK